VSNQPAIVDAVALFKVRECLSGLRGYNNMPQAEMLLVRALQSVAVSVSHADAILTTFDDQCPTPREIKDVAFNTHDKFLPPQPSQTEQWEKEYGKPDAAWSQKLVQAAVKSPAERKRQFEADIRAVHLQALKDSIYYSTPAGHAELDAIVGKQERSADRKFWADALAYNERQYPEQMAALRAGREPEFPGDKSRAPAKILPIKRPITADTFAGVEPMHVERCHNCGGSGRLAGDDYCDECDTGRTLRRIEHSYRPHENAS